MKEITRRLAIAMIVGKMRLELVRNKILMRKSLILRSAKVYLLLIKLASYIHVFNFAFFVEPEHDT